MTYVRTNWLDLPNTSTAITAARLNNMETGIVAAYVQGAGGLLNVDIGAGAGIAISKLASYPSSSAVFLRGDGTWAAAGATSSSGVLASIPSAATGSGGFYFATDQAVLFFSNGSSWLRTGMPAGTVIDWLQPSGTVPTGWVAYDGTALPASTGIYADLFAHLGTTTTPDTRGRVTVAKGTHADVTTIGASDGLAVGSRRTTHKTSRSGSASKTGSATLSGTVGFSDAQHTHSATLGGDTSTANGNAQGYANGALYTKNPQTDASFTGITVNNGSLAVSDTIGVSDTILVGVQTGAEPIDTVAYIVTLKLAKL